MKIVKISHKILEEPKQFYDVVEATPNHNFLIKTASGAIVSHNCSFEDEISFQQNSDIEKQKQKAKQLISTVDARMSSRFLKGEKLPTLHIIASSKRTDQSFLETYIDMKKKNESKTTLIIDEPQWVIRTDKDSPRKFPVAVGNRFLTSEVLPLEATEADIQVYRDKGYSILMVPMGYYEQFLDDIDVALTDIAGISTSNSSRYISGERWAKTRSSTLANPFVQEVLTIGNAPDDTAQYYDFFDMRHVPREMMAKPLYIHLDMSVSGDKTGIAGTWIRGKAAGGGEDGQPPSKELYYQLAFSVAIKAPKGYQVSFEKNRQFIYWLKNMGFNIKGISTDTFQSYDTGQALKAKGYEYDVLSVDRVGQDRICIPYQHFKTVIYENRILTYETKLLTEEVIGLIRESSGKIDHTNLGGSINSKDICDAVCGSVYNASKHAEEYAYDFGESLDIITQVSSQASQFGYQNQINTEFENELKNAFDPVLKRQSQSNSQGQRQQLTVPLDPFLDFGMGKASAASGPLLMNGLLIW